VETVVVVAKLDGDNEEETISLDINSLFGSLLCSSFSSLSSCALFGTGFGILMLFVGSVAVVDDTVDIMDPSIMDLFFDNNFGDSEEQTRAKQCVDF
jgi:hypothetical protein